MDSPYICTVYPVFLRNRGVRVDLLARPIAGGVATLAQVSASMMVVEITMMKRQAAVSTSYG
ncbi:hypothetical protein R69746_08107 [Paraburkholderia aspalathi]|nr:hypothetical protein R69746_08107 [Paraburkholderia aspalathi]